MSYTHLQVRSGYSLMNSTITIEKLVKQANLLEFDSLALTDEHVLYGVIPFYYACISHGIKPIIGMTVTVENDDQDTEHCILLAKNNTGYKELGIISTNINQQQKKKINIEELKPYTENLICILPTGNHTKLQNLFETETHDLVKKYVNTWKNVFSAGEFYLGIQDHGLNREQNIHQSLKAFHETFEIPVTAISDVRYLNENDDSAYDCLQAMKNGNPWPMRITDPEVKQRHLRTCREMEEVFHFWPEVLYETEVIKDKCNVTFDFNQRMLPSFPVPENLEAHTYLENMCQENLYKKYDMVTDEIADRLTYELNTIKSMQFSDYFLIVADFIAYAKNNDILVGPGRGSSAGSIVAYLLGITDVDPIKYNLLFERFLNPERLTMPDIDVDFSDARRDEIIDYVKTKYGEEHVAQIITFGTFAARSLLRELIKTMEIDQQDADFILKQIPLSTKESIVQLVKESEELKQFIKQSNKLRALFSIAAKLEGIPRHISTHAAGIVISENPLIEHVPLTRGANDTSLTQFTMNDLEAIGLLKVDLLGLRNLTLLERIIQSIKFSGDRNMTLHTIPENDSQTFELLKKGQTNGVFQLESRGMKQVLTRLKPSTFEDIVAVNALYRPGPMDFIQTYIDRKYKREKVTYPHPDLKPILEKTYGVLVYQEQIMQIANRIAGFSLGKADILRRAVSKKKQDVMDEQKQAFLNGCMENGYSREVAEEIFSWIVKFSNYGFPRSHAVAYSKISYQLSYLKAHYPASFFAELLSSVANQQDKVQAYIKEIKDLNLSIAAPSINKSFGKYSVEQNTIRMGLLTIKGIGNQVVQEIIRVRKEGKFKNLFDFCLRVSLKVVNRKIIELLIMAGAFDETYSNRASLLASIDQAMEQGELFREFHDQPTIFQEKIELEASYVEIEDFSQVKKLADEKELLGIYVSSHPLTAYRKNLRDNGFVSMKNAENLIGNKNIKTAAIIQNHKKIRTKRGDPMAFITIGDETGDTEAVVFPELYRESSRWLEEEMMVMGTGKIESRNNRIQWLLAELRPFDENELISTQLQRLFIQITEQDSENALIKIKNIAQMNPGSTPIIIHHEKQKKTYQLSNEFFINPNFNCLQALRNYFGKDNVVLKK
ncbi:DNA polymerase III subunit alpha [Virgibacillus profundi]|uniref:DNA polymerase III subunit alpha n=1 Tax=Virgibacillus profundi TaxID=2024555 RepID=A0A2A2IFR3_9BACI|nr:DNA polymerase III subunit alpha [Virgibacillus profundi]PAV30392.1 DNA polymerase III subunit alpha [Virgibacillus profundi]PXY54564.1 DNA polymerase III subunit alpha [Virgibacillus profundi]